MKIINDQGKIFGKINFIDAVVIAVILLLIPAAYQCRKIMTLKPEVPPPVTTSAPVDYIIAKPCRICYKQVEIKIPLGERPERFYKMICPHCKNNSKLWIR